MKKAILLLLFYVACFGYVNSQTSIEFFEDFSDFTDDWNEHPDWTVYDVDGLNDQIWTNSIWRVSSSWEVAMCSSNFDPPGQADDWLILPLLSIASTNTPYLRWVGSSYASNNNSGNELSDYEVLISTTTNEISSFTLLETFLNEPKSDSNHFIDLSTYAGQDVYIAFRHISNNEYILRIHELEIGSTTEYDARLLVNSFEDEYILEDEAISNISLEVTNTGVSGFSGFTVKWDLDNGSSTGERVYTSSMPLNGSQLNGINFNNSSAPPNSSNTGIHNLKIWVELPSSTLDLNNNNDTVYLKFYTLEQLGGKRVMLDENTGTWCGPCADGVVRIKEIKDEQGELFIPIAFHSNDIMSTLQGDTLRDGFFFAAPQGTIDRYQFENGGPIVFSRNVWKESVKERLSHLTPFDISISNTYDSLSREIEATVSVYSYGKIDIAFNVGLYIIEDNVSGNSRYDQRNSSNDTPGHPFQGMGDPIPNFVHQHVFRAAVGSVWGNPGHIPNPTSAGGFYQRTFTYTLPEYYDQENGNEVLWENIHLAAFVAKKSDAIESKSILNAVSTELMPEIHSSVDKGIETNKIQFFPNPSNGNVKFINQINGEIQLDIFNSLGEKIRTIKTTNFTGHFSINRTGLYIIRISKGSTPVMSTKVLIID